MTSGDTEVRSSSKDYLQRAAREAKAVVKETTGQALRFLSYFRARWRLRHLERDLIRIRLELANEMTEEGVGDEHLRQQIAQLDDRIKSVTAAKGSTSALQTERRGLQLRLTEPLLQDNSVPIAIAASHARLKTAETSAVQQLQIVTESRGHLFPAEFFGWRRLFIGVCIPLTFGVLVLRFAVGTVESGDKAIVANPPPVAVDTSPVITSLDEKPLVEAVGLVVCGLRVTESNGKQRDVSQGSGSAFAITPD